MWSAQPSKKLKLHIIKMYLIILFYKQSFSKLLTQCKRGLYANCI
jgi:hypothetical protein